MIVSGTRRMSRSISSLCNHVIDALKRVAQYLRNFIVHLESEGSDQARFNFWANIVHVTLSLLNDKETPSCLRSNEVQFLNG